MLKMTDLINNLDLKLELSHYFDEGVLVLGGTEARCEGGASV